MAQRARVSESVQMYLGMCVFGWVLDNLKEDKAAVGGWGIPLKPRYSYSSRFKHTLGLSRFNYIKNFLPALNKLKPKMKMKMSLAANGELMSL